MKKLLKEVLYCIEFPFVLLALFFVVKLLGIDKNEQD
jgi:hypothetical protein